MKAIILGAGQGIVRQSESHSSHQVLIQPQMMDAAMSGVLLTRSLEAGAPYFVVNYDEDFLKEIAAIQNFVKNKLQPRPNQFGSTTVLGVMPDWNPAEIVGLCPTPGAFPISIPDHRPDMGEIPVDDRL